MSSIISISLLELAFFGFFTGLGTTFGTELAKFLIARVKSRANNVLEFRTKNEGSSRT